MKNTEIIVAGAGAAGLMAAVTLAKAGKKVTVLEARNRIGGRIHSINNEAGFKHAELGAEFIHGNLPLTMGLLQEAGIATRTVDFEMWHYNNGRLEQNDEFVEGWEEFLRKLNQLEHDMPIYDFLQQNFGGQKYAAMRKQIADYVSGYDTADIRKAGAFALRTEWNHEDTDAQHRIEGGYGALMDYLADCCRQHGGEIRLNTAVTKIVWGERSVTVTSADGSSFVAEKLIVALPLSILQADAVIFSPLLPQQAVAFRNIGFGAVIKILLEFDAAFWKDAAFAGYVGADLSSMGFLFTGNAIPTFWTQAPDQSPLLTGWLGGPPASRIQDQDDEAVLQLALDSMAPAFRTTAEALRARLRAWKVVNWTKDPFTLGSYAYDKVESKHAKEILSRPVENTIYFAGEYLYEGPAIGTVEAALTSGAAAAESLLGT